MKCFKAYDIRGKVPEELNTEIAYHIGLSFAELFSPKKIAVGYDIRKSSPGLTQALSKGLTESGVNVVNLGLCGTEEVYFAAMQQNVSSSNRVDGGIMVTASHNPAEYNGMKFVGRHAKPISSENGLQTIEKMVDSGVLNHKVSGSKGTSFEGNDRSDYISHLLRYIDVDTLKPMTVVTNAGNGCAGPVIDILEEKLPFLFTKIHHNPDGNFPNGVPNPLLPDNRKETSKEVIKQGADLGIAWDGDFDRCFFFDEKGRFIEGYYIVGLLAKAILAKYPGAKIIHDPRLIWNTKEIVQREGGIAVMSRTGHAFIKDKMRAENAAYGGEMSAHHYFRDFGFCDSGMIPWLLVTEIICRTGKRLSVLVDDMIAAFPVSGEINSKVKDPQRTIEHIKTAFDIQNASLDYTDGLSISHSDFRFNVRMSNTEPVLRLNVETRGDQELLSKTTSQLLSIIRE